MTATAGSETDVDPGVRLLGDRFRRGQESALEEAFQRWAPLIQAMARRVLPVEAHADDITQQVFVKAWRGHASFDPAIRPLPAWLVGIARHTLADHFAVQARDHRLVHRLAIGDAARSQPHTDDVVDAVVISQGLAQIAEPRRHVLELAFLVGLTQSEIAERTGLPLGTVKSHVRRGLIQLRTMVEVTEDAPR